MIAKNFSTSKNTNHTSKFQIILFSSFVSFHIRDRYHVVLEDNVAKQSRDNGQNNHHKSQKHYLYPILKENVSKPWFMQL